MVDSMKTRISVALVTVVVIVVVSSSGVLDIRHSVMLDDLSQLIGGVVATVTCWWTARTRLGAERRWRILMGAGMLGWSVGMVFWALYRSVFDAPLPSPSIADIGFFVFPVFAAPALLTLAISQRVRPRGSTRMWAFALLDGSVIVGSLFVLSWSTGLGAIAHSPPESSLGFLVAIMYPITDVVLVTVVLVLALIPTVVAKFRAQLWLLFAGMVSLAVSDTAYAFLIAAGGNTVVPIADAGYIAGPVLVALAASVPAGRTKLQVPSETAWRSQRTQLIVPYVLMIVIAVVVGTRWYVVGEADTVVIVLGVVVLAVALVRQILTLLENEALLHRVSRAQSELSYRAHFDGLTGLANRVSFDEHLAAAIEVFTRTGQPYALMLIDLDDFKTINDRFGHAAGDKALKLVSERLADAADSTAHVARFGGDEFVVLVDTTAARARETVLRIVDAVSGTLDVDGQEMSTGVCVGVVEFGSVMGETTPDALLRRADRAMYQAKGDGKGRAFLYRADDTFEAIAATRHHGSLGTNPNSVAGEPDPARLMAPPTRT
ncbi:diguanylate cyclase domain-containing protein [Actinomycetes bacterium M1A6_2h]